MFLQSKFDQLWPINIDFSQVAILIGIVVVALALRTVIKRLIVTIVERISHRQSGQLIQQLQDLKVVSAALQLAPLLAIDFGRRNLLQLPSEVDAIASTIIQIGLIVSVLRLVSGLVSFATQRTVQTKKINAALMRTFSQVISVGLFFVGGIGIVSILLNKSPVIIFSSLGALSAILLLVFKDALLGFAASIQVSILGIAKEGDWIEMPNFHADGTILDINLSSIRVQNWDKTIVTSHFLPLMVVGMC